MEKVVAYVLLWSSWRPKMDESNVDRTSSEEVIRTYFSVAWTVTASITTWALSKATLEGTKLILHCKITWTFRTIGLFIFITLVLLMICILEPNQGWLQEKKLRKKEDKRYSSQPLIPWWASQGGTLWRDKTTTGTYRTRWKECQNAVYWISLKKQSR